MRVIDGSGSVARTCAQALLSARLTARCPAHAQLSAYIIGNVSALATGLDSTREFREQVVHLESFMGAHHLDPGTRRELRQVMQLRQNESLEHREVLETLPPVLRRKLKRMLHRPLIQARACAA